MLPDEDVETPNAGAKPITGVRGNDVQSGAAVPHHKIPFAVAAARRDG